MTEAIINSLKEQYPYAVQFFDTFLHIEKLCHDLAKELPPPVLPTHEGEHILGKSLYPTEEENLDLYFDENLLEITAKICEACAQYFPELKDNLTKLSEFLVNSQDACKCLASFILLNKIDAIEGWSEKNELNQDCAALVATYLARTAAVRIALHSPNAQAQVELESGKTSQAWQENYCPVCGHLPNIAYFKFKEGHRYLHCSLCHSEWRFPRTVCPACKDDTPTNRMIFNLEGSVIQRAEGCDICKRYLLVSDTREMAEKIPMYALLYCLIPMDILMQEKGYEPID